MNLMERAETRRETFYKLTNSVAIPEAPSEGGRNLLVKTNQGKTNWTWVISSGGTTAENYDVDGVNAVKLTRTKDSPSSWDYIQYQGLLRNLIEPDTKYTLSFDVKPSVDVTFTASLKRGDGGAPLTNSTTMNKATANQWNKVSCVLTSKTTLPDDLSQVVYLSGMPVAKGNYLLIKSIKLEKGNTATPYSQAPEDLGWSATTLVPTQSQRYLWKFDYIYYSDGSVEVTQPTNISIAGADGTNGQTSHVHFAFADNATGGGFSLTTPKAYMGWYADFNEAASTDPTKYRWGKWKGDQGLPGKPGADGRTPYLHIAYANSADGRTDFSTSNTDNKRYLGTYTDYTQADSTDPSKYKWVNMVGSVEVGGRNLLLYTADPWKAPNDYYQFNGATKTDEMLNGSVVYKTRSIWSRLAMNWGKQLIDKPDVKVGDEFTYSVYVRTDQESPIKARLFFRYSGQSSAEDMTGEKLITQEWQRFTKTFTVTKKMLSDSSKLSWVGFEQTSNSEDGKFVYYACNMLEEGNIPTPWQPALEDIQADIDSKADQTLTQEQLNALAEKNSIIKAEMEAKASIDTVNQWITAYQNYVNANDEARAESEKNLQEAAARILQLKTDVGALRQQWDFIDTYMSIQNEGLIIGKSDGSAFAKFANDRISLFSGSSEVMYISQGTLHIENGIFTKTIQIGRFRFETHPADKDMLVLRYLGG